MIRAASLAAALLIAALPARAGIEIQEITSPGGLTAWLVEAPEIPIVTIEAEFRGGTALDPEGQEGAVRLMAGMLGEGAGDLDATAFAEAREDLAARISFDARLDGVTVSATMLTEFRDQTADLLALALTEPRFDAAALERVRGQLLSLIRSDAAQPGRIAFDRFYRIAFDGHPYARPSNGTAETVAELDAEALRAAHAAALARDRLHVAIVGDIDAEAAGALLDRVFGDLPAGGADLPPVAEAIAPGTVEVVDFAAPQSTVVFGHGGIPRDDPDFIPAFVMNHMLGGGGFASRLQREIRERRGLTYGIYSYLAPNEFGWLYLGSFSASNARVGEAIEVLRAEWARMAEGAVTEAELDDAKRFLTGAYALRFDGNARIAGQVLGLQVAGLGRDYVNIRNDLVEAVTLADIQRVAARMLDPEALTMVVVGQPEGVEATH